jgi:hypothetical protein
MPDMFVSVYSSSARLRWTAGSRRTTKLRWLLIQVAPETLLPVSDIFSECIRLAGRASTEYLEKPLELSLSSSHRIYCHNLPCFACSMKRRLLQRTWVTSDPTRTLQKGRPILSEILRSWRSILPNLIVSGTGISMSEVETDIGSVVAKQRGVNQKR